jgi:RHS repeat-associated protein
MAFGFSSALGKGYNMPVHFWFEPGHAAIYEGFNWVAYNPGGYSEGHTFRLERRAGQFIAYQNGAEFYRSSQINNDELRMNGLFYYQGAGISNVNASFGSGSGDGGESYYLVRASDTWNSIAALLYGSEGIADELESAMGGSLNEGDRLTGFPASLTDDEAIVTVTPYYPIPSGATWSSLSSTLYGSNAVADELQTALGDPALVAGQPLRGLPDTLTDSGSGEPPAPSEPYYPVTLITTWASIGNDLYGSAGVADELQAHMSSRGIILSAVTRIDQSNFPSSLIDNDVVVTVPAYYPITSTLSWETIARTLYSTTDDLAGPEEVVQRAALGITNYQYSDSARPHRLSSTSGVIARTFGYDNNGNIETDGLKTMTYNAHNKVRDITQGGNVTRFEYGPDRRRFLRVDTRSGSTTETLYVGDIYERVNTSGSNARIEHKFYVGGIAIVTQTEGANTEENRYLISDYQASVVGITNSSGALIQRFRYSAYGEQQEVSVGVSGSLSLTTKGYTSHEHIDDMNIIHMNGRIYDPTIGRMMQSDPIVQAPEFVLSYNRYAYVWNNPMNRIDPTGYSSDGPGGEDSENEDSQSADPATSSSNDAAVDGDSHNVGEQDAMEEVVVTGLPIGTFNENIGGNNYIATVSLLGDLDLAGYDFSDVPVLDDFDNTPSLPSGDKGIDWGDIWDNSLMLVEGMGPAGNKAVSFGLAAKLAVLPLIAKAKAPKNVSNLPVPFDYEFATRQLLGVIKTPGGKQINFHAADRMVNPPKGREPMSVFQVEDFIDTADQVQKISITKIGTSVTLKNSKYPGAKVAVDGNRIITVVNQRKKK